MQGDIESMSKCCEEMTTRLKVKFLHGFNRNQNSFKFYYYYIYMGFVAILLICAGGKISGNFWC